MTLASSYTRSQEFFLKGALLRPEGPKFEAVGRQRARGSWREDRKSPKIIIIASESLPISMRIWGSAIISQAGFRSEPQPQMNFFRTNSPENASNGNKMSFSSPFSIRFGFWCSVNLGFLGAIAPAVPLAPLCKHRA